MGDRPENLDSIQRVLEGMRAEYWQSLEDPEPQPVAGRELLFFALGSERFALAAERVREVVRMPARLVPVPQAPPHIRGIFSLRGEILAVCDLGGWFGLPGAKVEAHSRLLVVTAAGIDTALLAERVEGLRSVPLTDIEPLSAGLDGFPRELAAGQLHDGAGPVVLLDLEQLFARPDFVVNDRVD